MGLQLDFEDKWDLIDQDAEELTLRSLFHSSSRPQAGEVDNNNDGDFAESFGASPDVLIFVIDFREDMAKGLDGDENNLLSACLRCAAEALKDNIITHRSDLLGVVGFGTKETSNPSGFSNISVLRATEGPDAAGIVELERLADDHGYREKQFGHLSSSESFSFHHVLWTCRALFGQLKSGLDSRSRRRVLLFTSDEDPSKGEETQRTQSVVQARDLADAGATLEVICLKAKDTTHSFDPTKFYKELLSPDQQEDESIMNVPVLRSDEIKDRLKKKSDRKHLATRAYISLDQDRWITLAGYSLVRKATKSSKVNLDAATNKPTRSVTTAWCSETAASLYPKDIAYGYHMLDTMSCLTAEDRKAIKSDCSSLEFRCIGFIEESRLPWELNTSVAVFFHPLFPEETKWTDELLNQTKLFAALHRQMTEDRLAMIVYGSNARVGQLDSFGAFIPQQHARKDGDQEQPPGWLFIPLPFADDVRGDYISDLRERDRRAKQVSAEELRHTHDLLEHLRDPTFDVKRLSNPVIRQHYSGLLAIALGKAVEPVQDTMLPDPSLETTALPASKAFLDGTRIDPDESDSDEGHVPKRRRAEGSPKKQYRKGRRSKES